RFVAEPDELEQVASPPVALLLAVRNPDVRLLPRAIEQREDAVVEDAEEFLEGVIAGAHALGDVQTVRERERALRTSEPEKVHRQARRRGRPVQRLNLARGKADARRRR